MSSDKKLTPPINKRFIFTSALVDYQCWSSVAIHLWGWMKFTPEGPFLDEDEKEFVNDGFMKIRKMTRGLVPFMDCARCLGPHGVFNLPYAMSNISHVILRECDDTWRPFLKITSLTSMRGWPNEVGGYDIPWRLREEYRMVFDYKKVPWHDQLPPIPDHFVHISQKQEGMIAYTPDEQKGKLDRQTVIKPGRYLQRFYNLSPCEVRDWATKVEGEEKLKFAKTAEEIIRVYERGPNSCMSKCVEEFRSHIHPCAVYGDSDLQLAYLQRPDGRITDRVLVWPEKKKFGRVYGAEDGRIERKLSELGYSRWDDGEMFAGARIRRIPSQLAKNIIVMPYLDGARRFDVIPDDTEWVRVGDMRSPYCAEHTDGLALVGDCNCAGCGDNVEELSAHLMHNDAIYCSHECMDEHVYHCESCDERYSHNEREEITVQLYSHDEHFTQYAQWCDHCTKNYAFLCHGQGAWFSNNGYMSVNHEGHTYEKTWFDKNIKPNLEGEEPEEEEKPTGDPRKRIEDDFSQWIAAIVRQRMTTEGVINESQSQGTSAPARPERGRTAGEFSVDPVRFRTED